MLITFEKPGSAPLILGEDDRPRETVGPVTPDDARSVQDAAHLRASHAEFFDRGNWSGSLTFETRRVHAGGYAEAVQFKLTHKEAVGAIGRGLLVIQPLPTSPRIYYPNAVIRSVKWPKHIGARTHCQYTFAVSAVSLNPPAAT